MTTSKIIGRLARDAQYFVKPSGHASVHVVLSAPDDDGAWGTLISAAWAAGSTPVAALAATTKAKTLRKGDMVAVHCEWVIAWGEGQPRPNSRAPTLTCRGVTFIESLAPVPGADRDERQPWPVLPDLQLEASAC